MTRQHHLEFGTRRRPASAGHWEDGFHPAVSGWFADTFGAPTAVQRAAWTATTRRQHTLIAAPTGSGKTLAAFLGAINDLVEEGLDTGLDDSVHVLYVSPLKALSNDIRKNLQAPLEGIRERLQAMNLPDPGIRDAARTGDTSSVDRARMRRNPPHILITTPESLFILLSSESGRAMLRTTRSVIVDELHAVAATKRGAHLALSLERLEALCERPPLRIGLSATMQPIETMAQLLVGGDGRRHCTIVDTGHVRERDIALEVPRSPLTAVMATEVWAEIYTRMAELVEAHRSTLIFVNQRRMAERVARHLAERIGEEHVTAHHGSLAREHRLKAEQRLKSGGLKALVATASLELGIDIGDVDLVIQIGSPRAINAFLQRVGRSGHAVRATPKGRLFPLSLDDLAECAALVDCVRRGQLDRLHLPDAPLDVLAQQIVAETACSEWTLDDLFARCRRALPYRALPLERFEAIVQMLADGYSTRRGRRGALLHYDAVNRRLRGRRGARLTSVTNAGTIPDQFDYDVVLTPEDARVGTLNEDFAFESLPGDIVQLGNTSYRILKVETGRVIVEDAKGQPPTMPFWLGEAPGRSNELSAAVSRLRADAGLKLVQGVDAVCAWLQQDYGLTPPAARQLADYLAAAHEALGLLPTQQQIVFERFFDEVGDAHFVIHAPLGSRVLRAWGLALRKRFCRQFNFELQAAALDDSLVLSLGPTHSFPLDEVARYLHPASAREVLVQAVLQAPMFPTRWRWAASVALAIARNRNGRRVPPQFQRSDAEDLLTHAFPDAVACQDNLPGDREVPDHPLVLQALDDCLHEVMDVDGFIALLEGIAGGTTQIVCRDLTAPSPLSESILNARPYAFLDDGAAEERRTLAVKTRGVFEPQSTGDLGTLDPAAIARVREEMQPDPQNPDELHDALVVCGFLTECEIAPWAGWRDALLAERRIACVHDAHDLWVAAERLRELRALRPEARMTGAAPALGPAVEADDALRELLRSRMELLGPVVADELARPLGMDATAIEPALLALERQGSIMRGDFSDCGSLEWCERRRMARIHRLSRDRRRAEFEPVAPAAFMRFLLDWQGLSGGNRREGPAGLALVVEQLEGLPAAAAAWESDILPARTRHYDPGWLDQLCASGQLLWQRLGSAGIDGRRRAPVRTTPIVLLPRAQAAHWQPQSDPDPELSAAARRLLEILRDHGASFFVDLVADSGMLRSQIEDALGELVSHGLVSSDGFAGLRALIAPAEIKARQLRRGGVHNAFQNLEGAGRWALVRSRPPADSDVDDDAGAEIEYRVRVLLRRYGVVFRRLVEREPALPSWRELHYVLRRLEARGEIRGGRFVSGFSGEQFALPEAATALRRFREDPDEALVVLAGSDPLNLTGSILPGERLPAIAGNRLLLRGGVAVATLVAGEIRLLAEADAGTQWDWHNRLQRGASHEIAAAAMPARRTPSRRSQRPRL